MSDVECDATICDPPFGKRTHSGQCIKRNDGSDPYSIEYTHITPKDVSEIATHFAAHCIGWIACMTSSDLITPYADIYEKLGRCSFAPVPIIQPRVRLCGDGPASCATYMMVSRPRKKPYSAWGALPGWYTANNALVPGIVGAKPIDLMRKIVRHYSMRGDLVCDPYAGSGSTLRAAMMEGRRAIGAEVDPETFEIAIREISKPYTITMF